MTEEIERVVIEAWVLVTWVTCLTLKMLSRIPRSGTHVEGSQLKRGAPLTYTQKSRLLGLMLLLR